MDNLVVLNTKKYLGRKQVVLDCKFQIQSGREVQKVLAVCGNPILTDVIVSSGSLNFAGKVNLKLIYLTETGERESMTCIADFNETLENEILEVGDFANIELKVVDVTTPSIKANEVKVACILDAVATLSKNKTCEQAQERNGVFYKKSLCEIARQVACFKDTFDASEEFRIEGDLKCILSVDFDIAIKDCFAGNEFVVVEGEAFANIIYEDESDEIKTFKTSFGLKHEIQVAGINKDCLVVGEMKALDYLSKCTVVQGENCNIVSWNVPICVSGAIYENTLIDKIDDSYSCTHSTSQINTECDSIKNLVLTSVEDTVKGEVPLRENIDATLLGNLFNSVEISSTQVDGDRLIIEGVVSTTILYKDNETNDVQSVIAEFPFAVENARSEFNGLSNLQVKANIIDLDVSIKNDKIELVTKLKFNIFGFEDCKINLVTDVVIGEQRKEKDCAMEIVVVQKEQTLWELGKMLGVSTEQVLIQNPKLQEPLQANDRVVIYHNYCEQSE